MTGATGGLPCDSSGRAAVTGDNSTMTLRYCWRVSWRTFARSRRSESGGTVHRCIDWRRMTAVVLPGSDNAPRLACRERVVTRLADICVGSCQS